MSKKMLSSIDFGEKLYNTLPPEYRLDDSRVEYALERYLQALSDGGFAKVIDEINGLLTIIDPDKIDTKLLPILFQNYGFEIFNGLPDVYLRKLLPNISELFALKGTITSVEFLTSLISGVKSTVETGRNGNNSVDVHLEMDYNDAYSNELPDRGQLLRIVEEFVPFFCNVTIVYAYLFVESQSIHLKETVIKDKYILRTLEDSVSFLNGAFADVLLPDKVYDVYKSFGNITNTTDDVFMQMATNVPKRVLNRMMLSNGVHSYDKIIHNGREDKIVHLSQFGNYDIFVPEKVDLSYSDTISFQEYMNGLSQEMITNSLGRVLNEMHLNNISTYDKIRVYGKEVDYKYLSQFGNVDLAEPHEVDLTTYSMVSIDTSNYLQTHSCMVTNVNRGSLNNGLLNNTTTYDRVTVNGVESVIFR